MPPSVPIPELMQRLPLDRRGYPVPVIIKRDTTGAPMFTVNDALVQRRCATRKLCAICGLRLRKELWFVGGPLSAFHSRGCYIDSALHHECLHYALQVCPFLAMPNFRSTTAVQLPHLQRRAGEALVEHTMDPRQHEVLCAVMAYGQSLSVSPGTGVYMIHPLRPYHGAEFWRHGSQLEFGDGLARVKAHRESRLMDLRGCLRLVTDAV